MAEKISRDFIGMEHTYRKTSLKVNSVLERESIQPISTSILSNDFRNMKSVLDWDEFHSLTKLSKASKIRTNQFIFTKSEKR